MKVYILTLTYPDGHSQGIVHYRSKQKCELNKQLLAAEFIKNGKPELANGLSVKASEYEDTLSSGDML